MRTVIYIATSLDGFIARPDGDIKWLINIPNPDNSDFGYSEFIAGIDAILMGRNTYEAALSFESWIYNRPVFVLSNILENVPQELKNKVELINGDLKDILNHLEAKGIKNLYIDGGKTIQSFLKEDLIDEMIITTVPILLGEGIPLFGHLDNDLRFKCEKVEFISEYLVKHYYKRDRIEWKNK
jgi:dihydrofolate reductase